MHRRDGSNMGLVRPEARCVEHGVAQVVPPQDAWKTGWF